MFNQIFKTKLLPLNNVIKATIHTVDELSGMQFYKVSSRPRFSLWHCRLRQERMGYAGQAGLSVLVRFHI
jgi:hypothetical protein